MLYRRIILVAAAMSLYNYPWVQLSVFVACSLLVCGMIGHFWPYYSQVTNRFELFNEVMVGSVGYLAMAVLGFTRSPIESENCGDCILWVIRIHIAVNIVYILYSNAKIGLLYAKRYAGRRAAKAAKSKN